MKLSAPIKTPVIDESGRTSHEWLVFFGKLSKIVGVVSGPTSGRPTTGLYPGMMYFDTSLSTHGKPIWINKDGSGWIDATGTSV